MTAGIDAAAGVQFASGQAIFDHIATNWFSPILNDARNNSCVLYSAWQKKSPTRVSGRYMIEPVRFGRNTGSNAIGVGADLPDPGSQGFKSYAIGIRRIFGRVKIDGETLRRVRTDGGAFATAMSIELEGQIEDMTVENNRMLHNDGSGRIAEVVDVAGTAFATRPNQSIEGGPSMAGMNDIYFNIGDRIAFVAPNGGAIRATAGGQQGFYVVDIPGPNTLSIAATPGGVAININTLSGGGGITLGDWIVRAATDGLGSAMTANGTNNATGFRNEPIGIGGFFADVGVLDGNGLAGSQQSGSDDMTGTSTATAGFQGLAATTANPFNRAVVLDAGGVLRPISDELLQQAMSDSESRNNANVKMLMSNYPTYNAYVATLVPEKVYMNTEKLEGGHTALSFNGKPWVKDRYCYKNRVLGLDLDEMQALENESLQPLQQMDEARWERLNNKDAHWTGFVWSGNNKVGVRERIGFLLCDLAA